MPPEHTAFPEAQDTWSCTGNPLQMAGLGAHHRNGAVAPPPTEISRQVRSGLHVLLVRPGSFTHLEHHMTAGHLLRMKPEVATARLLDADAVVLSVVAPHQ